MHLRYLFDCEGWHIRHPPDLNELCQVDPRLAELAAQTVERYEAAVELAGVAELTDYSKYSGEFAPWEQTCMICAD